MSFENYKLKVIVGKSTKNYLFKTIRSLLYLYNFKVIKFFLRQKVHTILVEAKVIAYHYLVNSIII